MRAGRNRLGSGSTHHASAPPGNPFLGSRNSSNRYPPNTLKISHHENFKAAYVVGYTTMSGEVEMKFTPV